MRSSSRSALLFGASICATLVLLAGPFGGIGFAHGTDPVTSGGVQYAYYNGYGACARANLFHQGAGQSPGNGYVAANTFTAVRAGACYPGTAVGALMDNWTTIIKTGGALCGGPSWTGTGSGGPPATLLVGGAYNWWCTGPNYYQSQTTHGAWITGYYANNHGSPPGIVTPWHYFIG